MSNWFECKENQLVWPRFDETYYDETILGLEIVVDFWQSRDQSRYIKLSDIEHIPSCHLREREPESLEPKTTLLLFREVAVAWLSSSWYIYGRLLSFTNYHQERTQKKHPDKNIFGHCGLSSPADFIQKFLPGCPCIKTFCDTNTNIIFCDHKGCIFIFLRYKPVFRIPAKTFLGILCRPHLRSFLEPVSRKQHIQIKITNNPNSLPLDNWQTRKR